MFVGDRRIQQQWSMLGVWYRLADATCIVLGLLSATRDVLTTMVEHYVVAAAVAIIVYLLIAELGGLYRSWRGVSAGREILGVSTSWACTVFFLLALAFAAKYTDQFSRISTADVVPGHALADRACPERPRAGAAITVAMGLQDASGSRSSASPNWDSNWRATSRIRPRWG